MIDIPYVIRKNGMYYAHDSCGYVNNVMNAELYTKTYAEQHCSHGPEYQAIPVTDLISSTKHIDETMERLQAMRRAIADKLDELNADKVEG